MTMISWDTLLNMQTKFTFAQNHIDQMTSLAANAEIYSLPKTNMTYQHYINISILYKARMDHPL